MNGAPIDLKPNVDRTTLESILDIKCKVNGFNDNAKNNFCCPIDTTHNGTNGTMNGHNKSSDNNCIKSNGLSSTLTIKAEDTGLTNGQSCKNTFNNGTVKIEQH